MYRNMCVFVYVCVCVCVCVCVSPSCACMREIGRVRLTPVHRDLYISALPHRSDPPPHLHRSAPVTVVQQLPPARVLTAVLPPLGCLPGLNVLLWLEVKNAVLLLLLLCMYVFLSFFVLSLCHFIPGTFVVVIIV